MLYAVIDRAFETLPDYGSHGAAEELEFKCTGDDRQALQLSRKDDERIALPGRFLRLDEAVLVALAVTEFERILGRDAGADLFRLPRVQKPLQPLAATDSHVVAALRADIQVAFELRPIQDGVARRTFDPQAFRHRAGTPLGLDAGGHDLFEPRHGGRS